jgi:hypothetical protein
MDSQLEGYRKQHCIDDPSDREHHQHMEVDSIRIIEGGQQ